MLSTEAVSHFSRSASRWARWRRRTSMVSESRAMVRAPAPVLGGVLVDLPAVDDELLGDGDEAGVERGVGPLVTARFAVPPPASSSKPGLLYLGVTHERAGSETYAQMLNGDRTIGALGPAEAAFATKWAAHSLAIQTGGLPPERGPFWHLPRARLRLKQRASACSVGAQRLLSVEDAEVGIGVKDPSRCSGRRPARQGRPAGVGRLRRTVTNRSWLLPAACPTPSRSD